MRTLWFILLLWFPSVTLAGQVTVFAAASLKGALDNIARQFEQDTSHRVRLVFAGTSALARQISHGAPADLFISANPDWMDQLQQNGAIRPDSRFDLAGNRLALIQHGQGAPLTDLSQFTLSPDEHMAVALTRAVPAGVYARSALQSLQLWAQVEPQLVQTDNVRAALHLVALGEARYGVVYQTDTRDPTLDISLLALLPAHTHPRIVYPVAQVTASTNPLGSAFLAYLQSGQAQTILRDHGFLTVRDPA